MKRIYKQLRLYSMAFNRNVAEQKISALANTLANHLVKIIALPDHTARLHWKSEVLTTLEACSSFNNLKTKSGKIPRHDLQKWLTTGCNEGSVGSIYFSNLVKYQDSTITIQDADTKYKDLHIWGKYNNAIDACLDYIYSPGSSVGTRTVLYNKLDHQ